MVEWLTPQEVANLVGLSASFIRAEIKAGELPARYVLAKSRQRGRYLIAKAAADAYVARLTAQHEAQVAQIAHRGTSQ